MWNPQVVENIKFNNNSLSILNQASLPARHEYLEISTLDAAIDAIKTLKVRGAPAIGIFSAYALFVHFLNIHRTGNYSFYNLRAAADQLIASRPTAVNLKWAVDRMMSSIGEKDDPEKIFTIFSSTASNIHSEDKLACEQIGNNGVGLIKENFKILTHCNAGSLATGGIGTALAPLYKAARGGINFQVYATETRPLGQGARLTYWELKQANIPVSLITDNMVGSLMAGGLVDLVIVGADRICLNGDFANKIGTYSIAVLAAFHKIPFYTAAPISTFDRVCSNGNEMIIENRSSDEIYSVWGYDTYPHQTYNPAFDVTPGNFLSGIITDQNLITQPLINGINLTLRSIQK